MACTTTSQIESRVNKWDSLKVILMADVVLIHALVPVNFCGLRNFLCSIIFPYMMPCFTMISGYWMKEKPNRILRDKLLYPFFLFSAVNLAIGFFYGVQHIWFGYAMWYLLALYIYNSITPCILRYINITQLILLTFILAMCYNIFTTGYVPGIFNLSYRISNFYIFYLIGVWLKKNETATDPCKKRILWMSVFAIGCLCLWINSFYFIKIYWQCNFEKALGFSIHDIVLRILMLSFSAIMSISLIKAFPDRRYFFTKYGRETMVPYMLHMIIVFAFSYTIFKYTGINMHPILGVLGALFVTALSFMFYGKFFTRLIHRILDKPNWPVVLSLYIAVVILVNWKSF